MTALAVTGESESLAHHPDTFVLSIEAHSPGLRGLAVSLLGDHAAAQDVVQDTLEAILRLKPVFASEANALAYARTAVVNRCRSRLRRTRTARRFLSRQSAPEFTPGADEPLLLSDEHRAVLQCFDRLPQRQREVLTLRHFSLLTDAVIAEVLGIAESTVRATACNAIKTLARQMKEYTND